MKDVYTGTYTGTGAAINIPLGFQPDYVQVDNITDGDECWKWYFGMTDGHALAEGTNTKSRITANGISMFNGTAGSVSAGFTIGSALSENAKVFGYVAYRGAR